MNSHTDLAFFVTLAESRSLSAAAQELGLSAAAVSRRLAALEARLGIRLMQRTTRRTSLTQEGLRYLEEGRRILADIETLEQDVSGRSATPQGLLRVNAGFGFGRHHIAPAIADFVRQHPQVEVQLQLTDRPMQFGEDGVDVCIRFGEVPDARVTSRKLASNRRLFVATPAYLKQHGTPASPADLKHHRCIVIRERDEVYGQWQLRCGSLKQTVKVQGPVSTNDGETALDWALQGLGILQRSAWHVAPYLRSGRLVQVLSDWELPSADIHAVYPARRNLSAKVIAFVDHLSARLADRHAPDDTGWQTW